MGKIMKFLRMKHNRIWIVLFALLAVCTFGGLFFMGKTAVSAAGPVQLDGAKASLFLPESYEQYLKLESPSDIAVCERYIAIAEEKDLYIFDRKAENAVYHKFSHGQKISKIQFSAEERLYFSDASLSFYELPLSDPDSLTASKFDTPLTTFLIEGETLFEVSTANGSTIYCYASLANPSGSVEFDSSKNTLVPRLAFSDGKFYTVCEKTVTIYSRDDGTQGYTESDSFTLYPNPKDVKSVAVVGNTMYYTVGSSETESGLYTYDLTTQENILLFEGDGYGALTSFGGKLYAVKGNGVIEYEIEDGLRPTGYEIASASDSVKRLSGAQDIARARSLLVTADSGNNRLSVYDMEKDAYSVIPLTYAPALVATDGTRIAAAAGNTVYVYRKNVLTGQWDETAYPLEADDAIKGLSFVYEKLYYVSEHYHGVIGETRKALNHGTPAGLASDLYGGLYIAYTDLTVNKFAEENFLTQNEIGERLSFRLPEGFRALRADFEGDLFCLDASGALYRNGEAYAEIDGADFVYSEVSLKPTSFALGFEDSAVYLNFGDLILKTEALGFPTLGSIGAEGVYEEINHVHAPGAADGNGVTLVDVRGGAVGIEVDLAALDAETEYFPFASYSRTAEDRRGVLLAEAGDYRLIALYGGHAYEVQLFRASQVTDAKAAVTESTQGVFLSSPCALYNYPCVTAAHGETLPRGERVKILSIVKADPDAAPPDYGYDFAYVEAETNARTQMYGYVPLSFLTEVDPSGTESSSYELVKLREDVTFTALDGEQKPVAKDTEVRLYTQEDGSLLARYTDEDGTDFYAEVSENMIDRGESDAWRIALIVCLSVLAVLIVGVYFYLLPRDKKNKP